MMRFASTLLYGAHVRANGIRQHYLRYGGQGPVVIAVPGIITPAAVWGFIGERLGSRFDTYILDVRGRGLSESGPMLDYDLDTYADDVLAFAKALGIERFTLLGHSMGARIGIRAARKNQAPFERLLLVDPPVSGPKRRPYPSPLAGVLKLLHAAYCGEAYAALTAPGVAPWPEPLLRLRAEWLHTCYEPAVVASHEGFHSDDIHADLPHINVPTALIAATRGEVILEEDEQELRRLRPGLIVHRVPEAGHQIPIDNPEGFFAAVDACMEADAYA
jgi:N-formylmaleamate deformylase